jgi:hypothetical protein
MYHDIQSFVKIASGITKLMGGGIHRQHGDCLSPFLFFTNKESRLTKLKAMAFGRKKKLDIWNQVTEQANAFNC